MKFVFFIAKRYLFNTKGRNIVSLISKISLFGIAIGTAALVIVMSVLNGFEDQLLESSNIFHPHLKITSSKGKSFNPSEVNRVLSNQKGIRSYSYVLEEQVLLRYNGREITCNIKGVDGNYDQQVNLQGLMTSKYDKFDGDGTENVVIVGSLIADSLRLSYSIEKLLTVITPNRDRDWTEAPSMNTTIDDYLMKAPFRPIGIFATRTSYDEKYIISPLRSLQKFLHKENQISSIEIRLNKFSEMNHFQDELIQKLPKGYLIENRFQQQELLYKILNTEKSSIFLILIFILIISSFNIISSLSMLIIEKKNDIKTLQYLGSSLKQIQNIFFIKGVFGVVLGSIMGLLLGLIFCLLHQHFNLIYIAEDFPYPMSIDYMDIVIIQATVLLIGILVSYYPSRRLTKRFLSLVN